MQHLPSFRAHSHREVVRWLLQPSDARLDVERLWPCAEALHAVRGPEEVLAAGEGSRGCSQEVRRRRREDNKKKR